MEESIRNRVDESGLITLDLERAFAIENPVLFDLAEYLEQGFLLREKAFRLALQQMDVSPFEGKEVALFCSTDAIVPLWSWMLVGLRLGEVAKGIHHASAEEVYERLFLKAIEDLDLAEYTDQRVIVKGCSEKVPSSAYLALSLKLKPVVKSLLFGEACSSVPLYKRR